MENKTPMRRPMSRQWRFSVVDTINSPNLREDYDDRMIRWNDATNQAISEQSFRRHRTLSTSSSLGDVVLDSMLRPNRDRIGSVGKASVFDDSYHSVYVTKHPQGAKGIFVLLQSPLLLVSIGIFSAFIGLWIETVITKVTFFHRQLFEMGFEYFLSFSLVAIIISCSLVYYICPQAAGSGLPQMKVAISGVDMSEFLSLKCMVVKILGLIAAYAAGLSIGREGPFIMISCCFADILMHREMFRRINEDSNKRLEMLACACAAGVAATFGTPFGGVLFSVEVTSSFYMVRNLPRSFFAALTGSV